MQSVVFSLEDVFTASSVHSLYLNCVLSEPVSVSVLQFPLKSVQIIIKTKHNLHLIFFLLFMFF